MAEQSIKELSLALLEATVKISERDEAIKALESEVKELQELLTKAVKAMADNVDKHQAIDEELLKEVESIVATFV